MRLPKPSLWPFFSGLAFLVFAYLISVGSGLDIDLAREERRPWHTCAAIMAFVGVFLLWLSQRRPPKDWERRIPW